MKTTKQTINTLGSDRINTDEELEASVTVDNDNDQCYVELDGKLYRSEDFLELANLVRFLQP